MSDTTTVHRSELDLPLLHRGKVRDVYEVDADTLLMVASDRVSAFDVVLPERWRDAVPVLQILALGSIFRLVGMPALALIRAQGRFGVLAVLTVILGVLFLIGVAIGATLGGAVSVAIAVSIFMLVSGPVQMFVAVRPGGAGAAEVAGALGGKGR